MDLANHSIASIRGQDQNIYWGSVVGNTNASLLGSVLPVMIMNGAGEGSHTDPTARQVDQFTQPVFEAAIWQLSNQCSSYNQQTDPNESQGDPQG